LGPVNLASPNAGVEELTRLVLADYPPLVEAIGDCESHFRQYEKNGTLLKSPTGDVGVAQINEKVWGKKAKELGLDIYTTLGNLFMARHVAEVQGLDAWVCVE
jgi:hypothetical protein